MSISRRDALLGAGAAAVTALPVSTVAADTKTQEAFAVLFRQLNSPRQRVMLKNMEMVLKVQRGNERRGWTEADDERLLWGPPREVRS